MLQPQESFFACNMTAIPADQREVHFALGRHLFETVQSVESTPDGYRFRLPTNSVMIINTATFISNERLCCSFFAFSLTVESDQSGVWLSITGREGVKAFIKAELSELLSPSVIAMMDAHA